MKRMKPAGLPAVLENGVAELVRLDFPFADIRCQGEDEVGVELQHPPRAAMIADGHAVMHFARVDGDHVPGVGLHETATATAEGFLRAAVDDTYARRVVHMARDDMACLRFDGVGAGQA